VPTFTVQALIDRAKAAADMHDDFVTDAQWIAWLNVEVPALETYLARAGYVLRESFHSFDANSSPTGYVIPTPLAIVGVYHVTDSVGRLRRLRAADPLVRMRQFPGLVDAGDATEFYAQSAGDNVVLYLYPAPSSGTYVTFYVPAPATLTTVASTVSYPLGWEERLVLRLARRARMKEETGTSEIDAALREVDQQIDEAVWSRLLAQTPAVRNVDAVERDSLDRWPPVSSWFFP
jgi:hypothetical protein